MKHLFLIVCLLLLVSISSCTKEKSDNPEQLPEWIQAKVTEVISEFNLCESTNVEIINFEGKTYYNISCAIWNCIYCQLFDEQGNRPVWNSTEWNDFFANNKEIKVVPACQ